MPPNLTDQLPNWVVWAVPVVFPILVMLWLPAVQALTTRLLTKADDPAAHWTERARLLAIRFRVWMLSGMSVLILFVGLGFKLMGPLQVISGKAMIISLGLLLVFELEWLHWRFSVRNGWSKDTLGQHFTLWGINMLVLGNFIPVTLLMAFLIPPKGSGMILGVCGGLLVLLFGTQIFRLKLFCALGLVEKAPERLLEIVKRAVTPNGTTPSGVYVVDSRWANAYAYPQQKDLMFTARILQELDDDELESITEHELGHLEEGASRWILSFGTLAPFAVIGAWHPIFHQVGIEGFAIALVAAVFTQKVASRGTHQREMDADTHALSHTEDEEVYARALEKLHRCNLSPMVQGAKRSTHPDLYDRMHTAGVTPDYPRPQPASLGSQGKFAFVITLFVLLGGPFWGAVSTVVKIDSLAFETGEDRWVHRALACGAGAAVLRKLGAEIRFEEPEQALLYLNAAAETKPKWWTVRVYLADAFEKLGRKSDALENWNEAAMLYEISQNQTAEFPGELAAARKRLLGPGE